MRVYFPFVLGPSYSKERFTIRASLSLVLVVLSPRICFYSYSSSVVSSNYSLLSFRFNFPSLYFIISSRLEYY